MERTEEQPLLCSRKRAAFLLSISVRHLDYLIERGHFKVTRIGSRVLIHSKQIERFAKGDWPQLYAQQRGSMPRGNPLGDQVSDGSAEQREDRGLVNQPVGFRRETLAENTPEQVKVNLGRPRKYATERERKEAANKYQEVYREKLRTRTKAMFPTCAKCSAPAICIHWIGEHSQGPKQGLTEKWTRILRDPEYAMYFAGFCKSHKPEPYFARAANGEVPRPLNWRGSVPTED